MPSAVRGFAAIVLAAARVQREVWASNTILLVRRPLTPALIFVANLLAYEYLRPNSRPGRRRWSAS